MRDLLLDGRYLVKHELGKGGFGSVYLASDQRMHARPVVVKVLLNKELRNEWSVKKFKQEVEALARVDHPSIIGILDAGELPGGNPYIVMQYVDGITLRSALRPEGIDLHRTANIVRQIGRALSAAHEKGILHRDLKPENIMLQSLGDGEEQVKVIDFGVAKVKNSLISLSTGKDQAVGTIAYMSPEQLGAQPLTPASDVFAFAVIAYEMVTGRRPANPESMFQLLEAQRAGVRVKPIDLRPALPEAAQAIILKALSFAPEDRNQRARDFGDQLARILLNEERANYETVFADRVEPAQGSSQPLPSESETLALETAHVLFMDIVGYSRMLIDDQPASLQKLQGIVRKTEEFQRAQGNNQLIRLPTGDGMALVFFGDPESPLRCALEISRAMKERPEIALRMGVHSGLVYRMADINTNMNVAGGGINMAQRVMDCGDSGHILVSKSVADDLGQLARWSTHLHDLGEVEVKHGVRVHIFNLYTDDVGNSVVPARLVPPASSAAGRIAKISAALVGLLLIAAIAFFALRPSSSGPVESSAATAPLLPTRSLTYSLTVQKMSGAKPIGEPFESTGQEIFGNGWKFRFNIEPLNEGALYLLNQQSQTNGEPVYSVLFPTPKQNAGSARLDANKRVQTGWNFFDKKTGIERLWIIWAAQTIPELDALFNESFGQGGEISGAEQISRLKSYLAKYSSAPPEVTENESRELATVTGRGEMLVNLIELNHKAY